MNTKNKTIALMLAAIMVSAVAVPMAMAISDNVQVNVVNTPPEVICKCEGPDGDGIRPGTQIYPSPDGVSDKTVTICACACDVNGDTLTVSAQVFNPDGTTEVASVTMNPCTCTDCTLYKPEVTESPVACDCSGPCQVYTGSFTMAANDPAGEYRVVVTANDGKGGVDKMQNRFFYESVLLITMIPDGTIDFGNVEICTPSYAEIEIHNGGNDPAIVTVSTEGLKNASGVVKIAPGDLDIAIDNHPHEWLDMERLLPETLYYCDWHTLNFSIHVKEGTPSGTYTGTIDILCEHAPDMTVLFENKDSSDEYLYEPNLIDAMKGDMAYSMDDCSYTFNGHGLQLTTDYCLIYYADDWPGDGMTHIAGGLIKSGQTDTNGDITLTGTLPSMPHPDDADYDLAGGKYGKVWLVPCSDYDTTNGKMKDWKPAKYLFEMETIDITCCS